MKPPMLILTVAVLACVQPSSVRAAACAAIVVEARGEQSRFEWLAKTKARANWRNKVRRTPGLGAKYAVWAQAQNTDERCLSGPAGTVCIFSGTPCRP